jgi:cellulose synthase/poly-beta-1,6-N-acetylglucosamine synthase-like glycosyltransferase
VTILIALILLPLIILTLCFALEVFVGLRPLVAVAMPSRDDTTVAIVVPAHDEAVILGDRLSSLKAVVRDRVRIVLVADNCTDDTADIGRRLGVEVVERVDKERRGKGFALDFAKRYLTYTRPDVVLIVDADCWTNNDSVERLISYCMETGKPCQAVYLQTPAHDASTAVQISTFAFFLKNLIRQRALQRLTGRVLLVGSGMAFPWSIFSRAELATDNIVEDLKLGQELALAGYATVLVEGANVWSRAETETNTLSQRRRWEGGFLQNALAAAPGLFARGLAQFRPRDIWAAISLMIPPVALLMTANLLALLGASIVTWVFGGDIWPLLCLGAALMTATIAVVMAWHFGGSEFMPLSGLLRVPFYILWKLPLYLGLVSQGAPKEWNRTERGER